MPSNKTLINVQKADMTLADLASNGGLLNPEQTDTFADQYTSQRFYDREYLENDGGVVFHCLPTLHPVLL